MTDLDFYSTNGYIHIEHSLDPVIANKFARKIRPLVDNPRHQYLQRYSFLDSFLKSKSGFGIQDIYYHCKKFQDKLDEMFESSDFSPTLDSRVSTASLLVEPKSQTWSTGLHRDYRDFDYLHSSKEYSSWKSASASIACFNQFNIALVDDCSFWVIPGSHIKNDSLCQSLLVRLRFLVDPRNTSLCIPNCLRKQLVIIYKLLLLIAGGVCIRLSAGDAVMYKNNILHAGVYTPQNERLTIHDGLFSFKWAQFAMSVKTTFNQ